MMAPPLRVVYRVPSHFLTGRNSVTIQVKRTTVSKAPLELEGFCSPAQCLMISDVRDVGDFEILIVL